MPIKMSLFNTTKRKLRLLYLVTLTVLLLMFFPFFWSKFESSKSKRVTGELSTETPKYIINEDLTGIRIPINIGDLEKHGSITVPTDWRVKTTILPGQNPARNSETKLIEISRGEYALEIHPFGTGRGRCGTKEDLENNYIYFRDKEGYEYFREEYPSYKHELFLCSNGVTGKGKNDFGLETAYGNVRYVTPQNPDNKILNIMDSILASYKQDQL